MGGESEIKNSPVGRPIDDEGVRLAALQASVRRLPRAAGVYLMRNADGQVIYIGKALDLRSRVRSYLGRGDGRLQIEYLMRAVQAIETIVTQDERQAYVLERDLINRHKPRYNIRLKDDKNFLNVRIDRDSPWPRIELVRRVEQDGALYFGPYTDGYRLKTLLEVLKRVVPLRTCSNTVFHNRQRPCLEFQIKRCAAPCCLPVDRTEYAGWVSQVVAILQGKIEPTLARLEESMEEASRAMRFEEAAAIRDRIEVLRSFGTTQAQTPHRGESRDVFAYYREGGFVSLCVIHSRGNRFSDSANFLLEGVHIDDDQMLEGVLSQYYEGDRDLPDEIVLPHDLVNADILRAALSEKRGLVVELTVPQIGSKRRLIELALLNARQSYENNFNADARLEEITKALALRFRLRQVPRRIECVDISNLQGSDIVGAVVSFFDGRPDKERYKRYNISRQGKPDDFAAIHEVVSRRLRRGMVEDDLPDLLLVDGGAGQLAEALRAREETGAALDIIALAKIRDVVTSAVAQGPAKHTRRALHQGRETIREKKPERIFLPGESEPIELDPADQLTHFLQRIRDEVHRYVLSFHRLRRSKRLVGSALDRIAGVGPERRRRLLRTFGSVASIREANVDDIARAGRMPRPLAEKIVRTLQEDNKS